MTWIKDANGNRCSVERWGSEEAARTALATLKRCSRCSGCSDCSDLQNAAPVEGQAAAIEIPIVENIHQRVYEAASAPGALQMNNVHACDTAHCRAGWAIHLAGEAGHKLESRFGWLGAAMKIYDASAPDLPLISPVRFYETNNVAMDDMKRMAELEAAHNGQGAKK